MQTGPDVIELRDFYRKPIGQLARRFISARIRETWPNVSSETICGVGFASPYLDPFLEEAASVGAYMPGRQGVLLWPSEGNRRSLLVDERNLPLLDGAADRVLLIHCLEMSEAADALMKEIWRVLSPRGSLLVVVPNRRGVWARTETTPFGHGRPYSQGQVNRLLKATRFTPGKCENVLFAPPAELPMVLKSAPAWERLGTFLWPVFSGVLLIEAHKEVYAPVGKKNKVLRPNLAMPVPAAPTVSAHMPVQKTFSRNKKQPRDPIGLRARACCPDQSRRDSKNTDCSPKKFCIKNGIERPSRPP